MRLYRIMNDFDDDYNKSHRNKIIAPIDWKRVGPNERQFINIYGYTYDGGYIIFNIDFEREYSGLGTTAQELKNISLDIKIGLRDNIIENLLNESI